MKGEKVEDGWELLKVLQGWMKGEAGDPWEATAPPGGVSFDELALRALRYQARRNPVYGRLLRIRGLEAEEDWRRFPPIPTRAFKEAPPTAPPPWREAGAEGGDWEAVFRTSGTTGGAARRGEHRVVDLSLYRASLLAGAKRNLLPDREEIRVLALLPPPGLRSESSLVHMAGVLFEAWDDGGGGFFAGPGWELDRPGLHRSLERAVGDQVPVLLLGTAFAFVHWLDGEAPSVALPEGSRIMETGGFKGRSRAVTRDELYRRLEEGFGVPATRIVNEYGMTELLSQFYEPVLREGGPVEMERRRLLGPPWVRSRILDPSDLSPLPEGEPGLLCHLDLANLFSAALVLTEDLGVEAGDGFRVLGRNPGAEPRGCSLSMEAWMAAHSRVRGEGGG